MGNVVDLVPGTSDIRKEIAKLHKLRESFADRSLVVIDHDGVDVTHPEASALATLVDMLEKAIGCFCRGRKP